MGYKKQLIKYSLTPELFSHLKMMWGNGFSYTAFYLAYVYSLVRLLPRSHPYLNPVNLGRYNIRNVMGEVRHNLVISFANIDQVIVYYSVILGFLLLIAQFCLFGFGVFTQVASASGNSNSSGGTGLLDALYPQFFSAQHEVEDDIAYNLLDSIFGLHGVFDGSNGSITNVARGDYGAWPTPMHTGLHELFAIYNFGILAVGFVIFLYFVTTVVAETAQTGIPFGKRFNHVWAPVRFIIAFGLLMPLGNGLCSAQMITLSVAKWGSNLATNGWHTFIDGVGNYEPMGNAEEFIASPNPPQLTTLSEFVFLAHVCRVGELKQRGRDIDAYLVGGELPAGQNQTTNFLFFPDTSYNKAREFAGGDDLTIRFGVKPPPVPAGSDTPQASIEPLCGELSLKAPLFEEPGAEYIRECYYTLIKDMWGGRTLRYRDLAGNETGLVERTGTSLGIEKYADNIYKKVLSDPSARMPFLGSPRSETEYIEFLKSYFNDRLKAGGLAEQVSNDQLSGLEQLEAEMNDPTAGEPDCTNVIREATEKQLEDGHWDDSMMQYGWGGAGIYYNKVAAINGAIVSAAYNQPWASKYPKILEDIKKSCASRAEEVLPDERFDINCATSQGLSVDPKDEQIYQILRYAQSKWGGAYEEVERNPLVDFVRVILGIDGIYSFRENAHINPLAQISTIGRSLIESSMINLFGAFVSGIVNMIDSSSEIGQISGATSGLMKTLGLVGLSIGFILFYMLPMLPFVYFFMAVGGWVKGVFEAMVGVPLWALAHMRIDGDGIPGRAAASGYFLLLEILIRPIMIIFGMMAALAVFKAEVQILDIIWDLVIRNLTGADIPTGDGLFGSATDAMSQFFYTVLYAIVVYIMALSSFKLVNIIPNDILRFMGSSVASFGDKDVDPAKSLVRDSYTTTNTMTNQVVGSLSGSRVNLGLLG